MYELFLFLAVILFIVILLLVLFMATAFIEAIWGDPELDHLDLVMDDDLDYIDPPTPLLGVVGPNNKREGTQ